MFEKFYEYPPRATNTSIQIMSSHAVLLAEGSEGSLQDVVGLITKAGSLCELPYQNLVIYPAYLTSILASSYSTHNRPYYNHRLRNQTLITSMQVIFKTFCLNFRSNKNLASEKRNECYQKSYVKELHWLILLERRSFDRSIAS